MAPKSSKKGLFHINMLINSEKKKSFLQIPFKCKLIYGKRSKNYLTPHNVRLHELFEYPFKSAFMYAVRTIHTFFLLIN